MWDQQSQKVIFSRDVSFNGNEFPLKKNEEKPKQIEEPTQEIEIVNDVLIEEEMDTQTQGNDYEQEVQHCNQLVLEGQSAPLNNLLNTVIIVGFALITKNGEPSSVQEARNNKDAKNDN